MKVYIGDREGEKARLLSLGIHPAMIYPNGDLSYVGIPSDLTLRVAGLRVPNPKEAKYINSFLETIGCYSPYGQQNPTEHGTQHQHLIMS